MTILVPTSARHAYNMIQVRSECFGMIMEIALKQDKQYDQCPTTFRPTTSDLGHRQ